MRFSLLHKLVSYLLVASGFAALALSGELAPPVLLLTLLLGGLSFFFDPERVTMLRAPWWSTMWTAVTLGLIALLGAGVARGDGVLLSGAHAICVLLVNKLWNRRASRDWLQAYVISFLMLVAGTVLNTDLLFAASFVAYVISATWALTLFHLRREMEDNFLLKHSEGHASEQVEVARILNSKRVVGGAFLAGTSAISATVFVISGAFFFLFPRVGFNVFFSHARRGLTVGFNDRGVELGGNGLIKDNDQVVMRVVFPDRPEGPPPPTPLYFRGISFDTYRNGRWSPSSPQPEHKPLKRWSGISLVGTPKGLRLPPDATQKRLQGTLTQEIYLEPMDASVLFLAERPVAIAVPQSRPGGPVQPVPEGVFLDAAGRFSTDDVFGDGRQAGIKYTAWSAIAPPPEAELRRVPAATPEEQEALAGYLDVSGVPEAVLELGRALTAQAKGPYAKAMAVQRHLQTSYKYTLDLVHEEGKEPLAEFLFERKQGHCEYFASAMAILLRAAGVPTRHVAGFYGGEWNEVGHYLQVRQRDAHAWVEVYLGAAGWVSFDATPPSAVLAGAGGFASRLKQMLDVLELSWFKYVIEYDLTTQMDLLSRFRRAAGEWSLGSRERGKGGPIFTRERVKIAAGVVALIALGLLLRRAWRRGPGRSSRPRVAAQAVRALERAVRALERRGVARAPSDTPRAIGARALDHGDPGAEPFAALVELYYEARFGGLDVDAARLDALARAVVRAEVAPDTSLPSVPPDETGAA